MAYFFFKSYKPLATMNIHAGDIGLSIVVPGSSLVVHTYTLWLYATLLLYMRFLRGARARCID